MIEAVALREAPPAQSARNVLAELEACFEDAWRARALVRRQLAEMDEGKPFDPVPVRLLCEIVAQARQTCQTAVNIHQLILDHQRFMEEKAEKERATEEGIASLFAEKLGDGRLAAILAAQFQERRGADEETARDLAQDVAEGVLQAIVAAFQTEE